MRLRTKEINMLEGPLLPKIVSYAIPLACASILQQLFNSADLAIIGRFENSIAMAAVGANSSLISLLISLFSGLSSGDSYNHCPVFNQRSNSLYCRRNHCPDDTKSHVHS